MSYPTQPNPIKPSLAALAEFVFSLIAAPTLAASLQAIDGNIFPAALSGDGSTVVGSAYNVIFSGEAARWSQADGFTTLGYLPGASRSVSAAYGVSADGSVVVGMAYDPLGRPQAFRWTQASGMVGLGYASGVGTPDENIAYGVSADGSVIVGRASVIQNDVLYGFDAFRWTQAGGMVSLGESTNAAYGVSADGSVVVGDTATGSSFRWTQARGVANIRGNFVLNSGAYFGAQYADFVSADGSTAVGTNDAGFSSSAAYWNTRNGLKSIVVPGSVVGEAFAASADGSVVVGSVGYTGYPREAFIWDGINGFRPLTSALSAQGLDMAGWAFYAALGISDDGRTILAYGKGPEPNSGIYWLIHMNPCYSSRHSLVSRLSPAQFAKPSPLQNPARIGCADLRNKPYKATD